MAQPLARITVTTTDAKSHDITLGGFVTEGSHADIYARRSDLEVGFVLGDDAVDALLEAPKSAPPEEAAP